MKRSKIIGTGSYLPPRIVTNEDLEKMVDTTSEWITERTGIKQRHFVDKGTWCSDIAVEAAKSALEMAQTDAEDLDMVILATMTPDQHLPQTAARIQARLGNKKAASFDLAATCSGFLYGVGLADQAIKTGYMKRVLIVGAEVFSGILDFSDRSTCILFGDGAGAAVLGPSDDEERGIYSSHLFCAGEFMELVEVPGGGPRIPISHESIERKDHFVKMRGKELFKEAVPRLVESAHLALEANHLAPEQINMVIPHQANIRIIDAVAKRLSVPLDRWFLNIDRVGNTGAASLPIALDEVVRGGRLNPGDYVLFVTVGGGLTYGSAVMRW
ncbi:MAG TPA: beta-ketoacyl-ACP synthase III [Bdellovibrionota bacterium]|nr:beta-ketoacyl-ACP synthase III [Bdellovibrionota bacterium]